MTGADERGFTLLEILLAVTVLGTVMAMLTLSLSATLRAVDATEIQEQVYHQAQTALRRISNDLAAATEDVAIPFTGTKLELDGQRADGLAFVSLAHLVLNREKQVPGRALIRYRLDPDQSDRRRLRLLRSDTLALPGVDYEEDGEDEARPFLLADNLRSIRFVYFDRDGQEFDNWGQEQDKKAGQPPRPLPAVVHCQLEFWLDPDKETALTFATAVVLPAGLFAAEAQNAN